MAHILKPGMCGLANHYDCVMYLKVTGENTERLLVEFLEKTLELTHLHKTIFCSVNFVEFSKQKLIAQLFGIRLDCFHTDIRSIAPKNCMVEKDDKDGYEGCIIFNLEPTP
jgi:SHS2 domain-containing protein